MEIGSTVTLTYEGKLEDGTVFGFATEENPLVFQTGTDAVVDGFEKGILELEKPGDEATFTIDEHEGYGEYLDDFVARIPREQIPVNNIVVGKRIWLTNSEDGAPTPATAIKVDNEFVTFDLNHPLAGHALTYNVRLLAVEDAPENFASAAEKAEHMKEQSKLLGGNQGIDYR